MAWTSRPGKRLVVDLSKLAWYPGGRKDIEEALNDVESLLKYACKGMVVNAR